MIQRFPFTLSRYLFVQFLVNFAVLLTGLLLIVYIFDTIELLRRAAKVEGISVSLVLQMGLYKLPEVGQQIFPFAILFSAMFTFWQLSKRSELVVVRAAGLSVWQFMGPLVAGALLIGLLQMSVINPLGAMFIAKFQTIEAQKLKRDDSLISLSDQGLWLRQRHHENGEAVGTAVLHAKSVKPGWRLQQVMALFINSQYGFEQRIDARAASLERGQWVFDGVIVNNPGEQPVHVDRLAMPTDLSIDKIQNSFADPQTISFWRLPAYIRTMMATGFDATSLKIQLQSLIARPIFFIGMVLLAACVSLRPQRMGGTVWLIVAGVAIGFVVFFLGSFLQALGASGQIPLLLAAWFPPLICCLLGVGGLMMLEDG